MKIIYILLSIIFPSLIFAESITNDFQSYITGMTLWDEGKLQEAEKPFESVINSKNLSIKLRVDSVIAYSLIKENEHQFLESSKVVIAFLDENKTLQNDLKIKLLLRLSKLYRNPEVASFKSSYQTAKETLTLSPDDSSALLNHSVACIGYAGLLKKQSLTETEPSKKSLLQKSSLEILESGFNSAQKITKSNQDEEFLGQAYNTMGRIKYNEDKFQEASIYFKNAYSHLPNPTFHRNRGWALFGGISKSLKGNDKLTVLKEVKKEFQTAIDGGDKDGETVAQMDNLDYEINQLQSKAREKK